MSQIQRPLNTRSNPVTLRLRQDLSVCSEQGDVADIRSRKARALLAIIALSVDRSVTRQVAAAMLWSRLERHRSLARLRDTLYLLRRISDQFSSDFLIVRGNTISFDTKKILIEIKDPEQENGAEVADFTRFLSGLEGVDSSLDQWLTNAREEQRLRHRGLGLPRADQYPSLDPGWTAIGPSIMVAEIETHGQQQYPTSSRELRNEIELTLTQLRWCSVIASTSIRRRRSSAADYCLICRVNPANESCRLSVCLSECREGTIVMSAEIDTPNEPRETLNRRLADRVAARLDSELLLIEARRHRGVRGSRKDDAYRLVLDAVPAIYRLEHLAFMRAGHSLDLAVVANRESTIAYTWLALWQIFLVGQGWAENRSRSMSLASRAAERALLLDPRDARALTVAGHVHAFLGCRIQEAIMLHQEALKMNPALPLAWALSGMAHAYAGRLEDALERLSYCLELAPHDPHSFLASHGLAVVYLLRGEYERATAFGRLVTEQAPCFTSGYKSYLSALGHIGSREEALRVCERLRALEPGFSLRDFHRRGLYRLSENQNRFTQGLRLAGLR